VPAAVQAAAAAAASGSRMVQGPNPLDVVHVGQAQRSIVPLLLLLLFRVGVLVDAVLDESGADQEVVGESGDVGQALERRVHVTRVAQVGQAHDPAGNVPAVPAAAPAIVMLIVSTSNLSFVFLDGWRGRGRRRREQRLDARGGRRRGRRSRQVVGDFPGAAVAPDLLGADVELDKVTGVSLVMLGRVIRRSFLVVGTAQHPAAGIQAQPKVGGLPAADVTVQFLQDLVQLAFLQGRHAPVQVGTSGRPLHVGRCRRRGHPFLGRGDPWRVRKAKPRPIQSDERCR